MSCSKQPSLIARPTWAFSLAWYTSESMRISSRVFFKESSRLPSSVRLMKGKRGKSVATVSIASSAQLPVFVEVPVIVDYFSKVSNELNEKTPLETLISHRAINVRASSRVGRPVRRLDQVSQWHDEFTRALIVSIGVEERLVPCGLHSTSESWTMKSPRSGQGSSSSVNKVRGVELAGRVLHGCVLVSVQCFRVFEVPSVSTVGEIPCGKSCSEALSSKNNTRRSLTPSPSLPINLQQPTSGMSHSVHLHSQPYQPLLWCRHRSFTRHTDADL